MTHLKRQIERFLLIYPPPLRKLLGGAVFVSSEDRFRRGDRVEGSYDLETGEVILWNPKEIEEEDLFLVLTHEWGHKVYHEWLSDKERAIWLKVHAQETFDFGLEKSYPSIKLPEEEFCTVFCIVSRKLYFKRQDQKMKVKKLSQRIRNEFPRSAALVETYMRKSSGRKGKRSSTGSHDITHHEVQVIKAWIRSAIHH